MHRFELVDGDDFDLRLAALNAMKSVRTDDDLVALGRLTDSRLEALWNFAERNDIAPIVAHALRDAGVSDEAWEHVHSRSLSRMAVLLDELDVVADALGREEIAMVALKNAGIARGIYPCPGCCPMGDLDVLIDVDRFEDAHAVIESLNFKLSTRSSVQAADLAYGKASGGTEYVKETGAEEVWFELQWRPVAGRWLGKSQEPDGRTLIARSVPIVDTEVRLLDPTDNMLQVALHTAKHSYVRAPGLRLHTDVDRLAALQPPDWDLLIHRCKKMKVTVPVFFSLALAQLLLESAVPDEVLAALAPSSLRVGTVERWLRRVDLFEPGERKFGRVGMLTFHALLYDDARTFAAAAVDVPPNELRVRHARRIVRGGARRVLDVVTRYDK